MPKTNSFKSMKIKAHAIVKNDLIVVGGKKYRIHDITPPSMSIKRHIILRPLKVDNHYEDASLFLIPTEKVTIYRKK